MNNSLILIRKFLFKRGFQLLIASTLIFLYGLFKSLTIVSVFSIIDFFVKENNSLIEISKIKNFSQKIISFFNNLIFSSIDDNFLIILISIGCLLFFAVLFNFLGLLLASRVQFLAFMELQLNFTRVISKKYISFFDQNKLGELLSRINKDSRIIMDQVQNILMSIFAHLPTIIILSIFLILIDLYLTILFVCFFIITILLIFTIGNLIKKIGFEELNKEANLNGLILEIIKNIKIVKINNLSSFFNQHHYFSLQQLYRILMKRLALKYFIPNFFIFVFFIFIFLILTFKFNSNFFSNITNADFITFIVIAINLLLPFQKINETVSNLFNLSGNSKKINEIISTKIEDNKGNQKISNFNNQITFKDVYFQHSNKFSINNLNFNIKKGDKIIIFGKSGSGKSTLIDLILKFYEPSSGLIQIDNLEYNNLELNYFRNLFGVSFQENIIFNDTILSNIIFDKEFNQIKFDKVIENAGLKNFINSLPNKNYTILGDSGSNLSGGLKQRLSIARVLYNDNPIFIFDEVTAALDDEMENIIMDNLFKHYKDKTIIMVTHKKKLINYFNKKLLLKNGSIEFFGKINKII